MDVLTWTELVMVLRAKTVAQSLIVDWLSKAPWVSMSSTATCRVWKNSSSYPVAWSVRGSLTWLSPVSSRASLCPYACLWNLSQLPAHTHSWVSSTKRALASASSAWPCLATLSHISSPPWPSGGLCRVTDSPSSLEEHQPQLQT